MEDTPHKDWFLLHEFSNPAEAMNVVTTILSMEFDAILVDAGSGSIVAGSRSPSGEPDDDPQQPIELQPRLNFRDPSMPGPLPASQSSHRPAECGSRHLDLGQGPWRVLVPLEDHEELDSLLEAIITEQSAFDARHEELRRSETTLMRYCLLGLFLLFGCFVLLRLLGVL